jgi:hypothetical protein
MKIGAWTISLRLCATVRNTHGPGPDDVLLGEYNHKFDAD